MVDGEPVIGVLSIEYQRQQVRQNVYGLGSAERLGMVSGPQVVQGRIRVASTSPRLDAAAQQQVQLTAQLVHGDNEMTVTFDECHLTEKSFEISVGGHGEAVYSFTATRVREELAASDEE